MTGRSPQSGRIEAPGRGMVCMIGGSLLLTGMGTLMWYMNSLEKRRKIAREARDAATKPPQPESA